MRSPVRLKNFNLRFLPYYAIGAVVLWWTRPGAWGFSVGVPLVLLGAIVRSWGAGHLVKNRRLTVTGPYAFVRHPLYVGTLLIALGFVAIAGGWIGFGVLAAVLLWFFASYFPRKEVSESRKLEELYGESFTAYRDRVPALVPSLTPFRPTPEPEGQEVRWSADRYLANNELGTALALAVGLAAFAARAVLAA